MSVLGDYFPEEDREDNARKHIQPGQVLYLSCDFTTPPKEKYLLIIGQDSRVLMFVINSQINNFIAARQYMLNCQIQIFQKNYDFLNHDSYINCAEVVTAFSNQEIVNQIVDDMSRVKGEINAATKAEIIKVVDTAITISQRNKNLIISALSK